MSDVDLLWDPSDVEGVRLRGILAALSAAANSEDRLAAQCLDMAQHWATRAKEHYTMCGALLAQAEKVAREIGK